MPYQVFNMPNVFGISNPQLWVIEKRPDHMLAPAIEYPGWRRMGARGLGQGDMAAVYEEQIRTLTNSARNLPNEAELINQANYCSAQAATVRTAVQPDVLARATADTAKCIRDLATRVEASIAAAEAPATEPAPRPSGGIPTAVWAVGALGILGVVIAAAAQR